MTEATLVLGLLVSDQEEATHCRRIALLVEGADQEHYIHRLLEELRGKPSSHLLVAAVGNGQELAVMR